MNLQHYDQISTIGKGTQGSIVLVKHKELLEYFILKVLDKNSIFKKNSHQHIYNELEVLQVLRHQSIVLLSCISSLATSDIVRTIARSTSSLIM